MIYEVGKQFPGINKAPCFETCRAQVNTAFFDIIYYIECPEAKVVGVWKDGKLRYGVYTREAIPYFIIDFPDADWNFDVNVNTFRIVDD